VSGQPSGAPLAPRMATRESAESWSPVCFSTARCKRIGILPMECSRQRPLASNGCEVSGPDVHRSGLSQWRALKIPLRVCDVPRSPGSPRSISRLRLVGAGLSTILGRPKCSKG
jgi:hypothetical protein